MKTIGQRIAQAREAKGWSGARLAEAVGYKNQSSIGNIESRLGGRGGHKIAEIARALEVPIEWVLQGPDTDEVPFIAKSKSYQAERQDSIGVGEDTAEYAVDASISEAMQLFRQLNTTQRMEAIDHMRRLLEGRPMRDRPEGDMAFPKIAA